ncbi:MAG: IS3 family transposase [Deltaproteobacteria bacterium]|nr:IS3 family transposase [Deltaproteobacteria bacterium]
MAKRPKRYPKEFREQVVELARAGRTPRQLADEFGITDNTVRNWVKQAGLDRGSRSDGLTTEEKQELARLRRENRQLKLERDILFKSRGLVRSGDRFDPQRVFELVRAHEAALPVAAMCRTLGVSKSGYYAWYDREPSAKVVRDVELLVEIKKSHAASNGAYGVPNIILDLRDWGFATSRKRIAKLMRSAGIQGVSRRRKSTVTTLRAVDDPLSPDLVDRNFTADAANKLWVADITFIPTWVGFLYLAVVLDVWSRKIVGWSMSANPDTELVLAALNTAVAQRQPEDVVHHSDQGCQYTSFAFGKRCKRMGVRPSMGSVGDAYDNAMCESFFASLECELIDRTSFKTHAEAKAAIFKFIEGWYNPRRRHSGIGRIAPMVFEAMHAAA